MLTNAVKDAGGFVFEFRRSHEKEWHGLDCSHLSEGLWMLHYDEAAQSSSRISFGVCDDLADARRTTWTNREPKAKKQRSTADHEQADSRRFCSRTYLPPKAIQFPASSAENEVSCPGSDANKRDYDPSKWHKKSRCDTSCGDDSCNEPTEDTRFP